MRRQLKKLKLTLMLGLNGPKALAGPMSKKNGVRSLKSASHDRPFKSTTRCSLANTVIFGIIDRRIKSEIVRPSWHRLRIYDIITAKLWRTRPIN